MPSDIELHLSVAQSISAIDLLANSCDLSRSRLKQVMTCGAVWLENSQGIKRLRRAKTELKPGEKLHLYYDAATIDAVVPAATLLVDKGDYSVWLKPQGMYSQGTKWGDHHTLGRWAEQHMQPQRPAKVVHRLDRFTWGVMLLAHGKGAAAKLTEMFRQRQVKKVYRAVTIGTPVARSAATSEANSLANSLANSSANSLARGAATAAAITVDFPVDGKSARSHVSVLEQQRGYALCEVRIETGRKHQVRSHLHALGAPIVGDRQFATGQNGAAAELAAAKPLPDMQLCAASIEFLCPVDNKPVSYHCPERLLPSLNYFS